MSAREIGGLTTPWRKRTDSAGTMSGSVTITSKRLLPNRTTSVCTSRWLPACLVRAIWTAEFHNRRAVELKPDYVQALYNCAAVLERKQEWDEAGQFYRRVLQVKPDHAEAQRNLASLLWRTGRIREAVPEYRRLLELRPNMAGVKAHLAKILATSDDATVRDGAQALQLAEEARRAIGDRNDRVFDALAAAYAELGRYDDACRAASRSLELAKAAGQEAGFEELESRLKLYQSRRPYRSTPTEPAPVATGKRH